MLRNEPNLAIIIGHQAHLVTTAAFGDLSRQIAHMSCLVPSHSQTRKVEKKGPSLPSLASRFFSLTAPHRALRGGSHMSQNVSFWFAVLLFCSSLLKEILILFSISFNSKNRNAGSCKTRDSHTSCIPSKILPIYPSPP